MSKSYRLSRFLGAGGAFTNSVSSTPRHRLAERAVFVPYRSGASRLFASVITDINESESLAIQQDFETADDTIWRQETLRLLSADSSWNTRLHWRKAARTLNWWASRDQGSSSVLPLLDRMILEVSRDESYQKYVTCDLLTVAVQRWCLDFAAEPQVVDLITPSGLASKLEKYRRFVPSIDEKLFRMIQEAASKRKGEVKYDVTSAKIAEPLHLMAASEQLDDPNVCPNTNVLNEYLLQLSRSEDTLQAAQKAEELLDRMWSLSRNNAWEHVRPDYNTYERVMRCCLRSKRPGTDVTMQALLEDMLKQYNPRFPNALRPGRIHYQLVISAWAERGNARKAEAILDEMKARYEETGSTDYKPVGKVCAAVLKALLRCQEPSAPDRAEAILNEMLLRYEKDGDTEWLPSDHCYTSIIAIWANSGRSDGATKAQAVFDSMSRELTGVRPSKFHYGALIHAWIKAGNIDRAEAILRSMVDDYNQGNEAAKPDSKAFLEVTEALSRTGATERVDSLLKLMGESSPLDILRMLSTRKRKGDAEQAETILRQLQAACDAGESTVKLTREHYNATITALSHSRDNHAAIRADALLTEMLHRYDKGDKEKVPSEHAFTSVIASWSRSRSKGSGQNAQAVFDAMLQRWQAGQESLRPTVKSYSALINAWGYAGDASRAEIVLQQMQDDYLQGNKAACPNNVAFNTVIAAWSRSKTAESLDRADQILRLMQELGKSGLGTNPDIVSFASIMAACIHPDVKDGPERAIAYLKEAKDLYAQGDQDCKPNCMAYGSVIQSITRSRRPGAAKHAEEFLDEMKRLQDQDPKQIVMAYTAVIGAWSNERDPEALSRAESLFRELVEHSRNGHPQCKPNIYTFTQLLKAVSRSSATNKAVKAKLLLVVMKDQGLEPDDVVHRLVKRCT
jgi:pentatricopeptide repeat protein